jgi:hypothetical protein
MVLFYYLFAFTSPITLCKSEYAGEALPPFLGSSIIKIDERMQNIRREGSSIAILVITLYTGRGGSFTHVILYYKAVFMRNEKIVW